MLKSIRTKVFGYFMGMIALILMIIWIGLNFYIEDYYYGKQIERMKHTVDQINDSFDEGETMDVLEDLEYVGYQFGGRISIYDETSILTIGSRNAPFQQGILKDEIEHKNVTAYIYETEYPAKGTRWLLYEEKLDNDNHAVLEIPVESIENTLATIKEFFALIAIISTAFAIAFSFVLSRNISRPVKELNNIAKEMEKLNFILKYKGKRKDEIGQLGQTLNQLTLRLEKTIFELQRELAKEKQLDVLRKSFVAQVSHELQTPMSVIHGYIEALQDQMVETDEEKEYYYSIIEDETAKMSKMVRELLDLSQLESGTYKMKKEYMDFTLLLDQIAHKYEKMAVTKGIDWRYHSAGKGTNIFGDSLRLEQAITNLLNNAFKHTEAGQYILFKVENIGDQMNIWLENEGEHIAEEELCLIWDSFYKGNTSAGKPGTGLGLAIAAHIFTTHGFTYSARNTQQGVAFEVKIPLID